MKLYLQLEKWRFFQQFVLGQFSRLHEAAKILAKREADLGVMWACGLTMQVNHAVNPPLKLRFSSLKMGGFPVSPS